MLYPLSYGGMFHCTRPHAQSHHVRVAAYIRRMAVCVSYLAEPATKAWPVFVLVWCELLLRTAKRH